MKSLQWKDKEQRLAIELEELKDEVILTGDLHSGKRKKSAVKEDVYDRLRDVLDPRFLPFQKPIEVTSVLSFDGLDLELHGTISHAYGLERKAGTSLWICMVATFNAQLGEEPWNYPEYGLLWTYVDLLKKHEPNAHVFGHFVIAPQKTGHVDFEKSIQSGFIDCFEVQATDPNLPINVERFLGRYRPWIDAAIEAKDVIPRSIKNAVFPYPNLRDGQRELILECREDIKAGTMLFVQAPTGIGKTISTLYPTVNRMADGTIGRAFYLTAKASTRMEAEKACNALNQGGAKIRSVTMSALKDACLLKGGHDTFACRQDMCEYAHHYYEKLPKALLAAKAKGRVLTQSDIRELGQEHHICPYALAQELAAMSQVVICDYNSVLDPVVYFRRFFGEKKTELDLYVLLIDEAHNLADRVRNMYSVTMQLSEWAENYQEEIADESERQTLLQCQQKIKLEIQKLGTACDKEMQTDTDGQKRGVAMTKDLPEGLFSACLHWTEIRAKIRSFITHPSEKMQQHEEQLERFMQTYAKASDYERMNRRSSHAMLIAKEGENVTLKFYCLDPSPMIRSHLKDAKCSVFFSATLTPQEYFADLFGRGMDYACLDLPSPFETHHLCVSVVDKISMRSEDREKNLKKVLNCIAATCSSRPGNYLVFGPSYAYLEKLAENFKKKYPQVPVVVQKSHMTMDEKRTFLDTFKDDRGKLRIGFCVLGGVFSEGVDLPGNRLIGSIILGTGIPSLSSERNLLTEYYEDLNGRGFSYAYTYPGMNAVLQAAGRAIRTEQDQGVVVLIDDRYAQPEYLSLFPSHWKGVQAVGDALSLREVLQRFWGSIASKTNN